MAPLEQLGVHRLESRVTFARFAIPDEPLRMTDLTLPVVALQGLDLLAPKERAFGGLKLHGDVKRVQDAADRLSDKSAPWKKLANETPRDQTIDYNKLLTAWNEGHVR